MDTSISEYWTELNKIFEENNYNGALSLTPSVLDNKKSKICLISVHGVNHYRGEKIKPADLNTGGLVRLLGELTKTTTLYNTNRCEEINPYLGETAVEKLITSLPGAGVFLDIHGAKDNPDFDLAIGTAFVPNKDQVKINEVVERIASIHGLKTILNHPEYSASKPSCLTYRLIKMGLFRAVQIEIVKKYRQPENKESSMKIVSFFVNLIEELDREFR